MSEGKKYTGDARLLFPNEYISAADLRGRDVHLTISDLRMETLRVQGGEDEEKPVLSFEEMEERPKRERKRLVLNKTNTKTLIKLFGAETSEWRGKRITLFPTECQAFGEMVDCLRIRSKAPPPKGKKSDDGEQLTDEERKLKEALDKENAEQAAKRGEAAE